MNIDLQETLNWCADNGVLFKITKQAGRVVATAGLDNIYSEFFIDEPYTAESLGRSMQHALHSVMAGTKFHAEYGHFPPIQDERRDTSVGSGTAETENRKGKS